MKISIIVPIYNIENYLKKCLDSIISQTYRGFEAILVNDGSTDNSSAIVDDYCKKDSRFISVHKKNNGAMSARQTGVRMSTGDYLCFIDGDDYIAPTLLEKLLEPIVNHNVDMSMCNFYYDYYLYGKGFGVHDNNLQEGLYAENLMMEVHKSIFPKLNSHYMSPSMWGKLIKRNLFFDNMKYIDLSIGSADDVNIMVPVTLSCKSFYYMDTPLMYYVQRPTSISHVFKSDIFSNYVKLINILKKVQKDKRVNYERETQELYNVYGVSWCIYVSNAHLQLGQKVGFIKKIIELSEFKNAVVLINESYGTTAMVYKLTMSLKHPMLFIIFYNLFSKLKK